MLEKPKVIKQISTKDLKTIFQAVEARFMLYASHTMLDASNERETMNYIIYNRLATLCEDVIREIEKLEEEC